MCKAFRISFTSCGNAWSVKQVDVVLAVGVGHGHLKMVEVDSVHTGVVRVVLQLQTQSQGPCSRRAEATASLICCGSVGTVAVATYTGGSWGIFTIKSPLHSSSELITYAVPSLFFLALGLAARTRKLVCRSKAAINAPSTISNV